MMISALSKTSNFFCKKSLLSLSLIPKCSPDNIKKNTKNKSENFNQKKKKVTGTKMYTTRKKNKDLLDFIKLNLLAVKISKLPWANPGQIKGIEKIINWLYKLEYLYFSNKLTNIKKKKIENINIFNSSAFILKLFSLLPLKLR